MIRDPKHDAAHELIARGIIIRDGVVLVNHSRNAKSGMEYYALPGGHVDAGESCVAALRRELAEEIGCDVTVGELRFVSESLYPGRHTDDGQRHELVLYFQATLRGTWREQDGKVESPEPDKDFRWLNLVELPGANLLPQSVKKFLLSDAAHHHASSESPSYVFSDDTH